MNVYLVLYEDNLNETPMAIFKTLENAKKFCEVRSKMWREEQLSYWKKYLIEEHKPYALKPKNWELLEIKHIEETVPCWEELKSSSYPPRTDLQYYYGKSDGDRNKCYYLIKEFELEE